MKLLSPWSGLYLALLVLLPLSSVRADGPVQLLKDTPPIDSGFITADAFATNSENFIRLFGLKARLAGFNATNADGLVKWLVGGPRRFGEVDDEFKLQRDNRAKVDKVTKLLVSAMAPTAELPSVVFEYYAVLGSYDFSKGSFPLLTAPKLREESNSQRTATIKHLPIGFCFTPDWSLSYTLRHQEPMGPVGLFPNDRFNEDHRSQGYWHWNETEPDGDRPAAWDANIEAIYKGRPDWVMDLALPASEAEVLLDSQKGSGWQAGVLVRVYGAFNRTRLSETLLGDNAGRIIFEVSKINVFSPLTPYKLLYDGLTTGSAQIARK